MVQTQQGPPDIKGLRANVGPFPFQPSLKRTAIGKPPA
nr:MAG TPA: hypothetical protein [Caudoviricetes sp.]